MRQTNPCRSAASRELKNPTTPKNSDPARVKSPPENYSLNPKLYAAKQINPIEPRESKRQLSGVTLFQEGNGRGKLAKGQNNALGSQVQRQN